MSSLLWKNLFQPKTEDIAIASHLKNNVLFQDLSTKDIKFVGDIVHLRDYQDGERIFRQGEVGAGMYIVVSGSVEISAANSVAEADPPPDEIPITRLEPSDFFGELALVEENGRRSATAVAVGKTTLIGFFKPDLFDILARNPRAGLKITLRLGQVLGQRLKRTTLRLIELESQQNEMAQRG